MLLSRATFCIVLLCPRPYGKGKVLNDDARLSSDVCVSVCLSVCLSLTQDPKSTTERHRKTKIGTEVAHVTHDSDTTFKVKRSTVNLQGAGAYCGGLPHSLFCVNLGILFLGCSC